MLSRMPLSDVMATRTGEHSCMISGLTAFTPYSRVERRMGNRDFRSRKPVPSHGRLEP